MVSKIDKKRDLCRIILIEDNVHKSHYLRQHQKIVALEREFEQRQPRPFTARQARDFFVLTVIRKQVRTQQVAGLFVVGEPASRLIINGVFHAHAA